MLGARLLVHRLPEGEDYRTRFEAKAGDQLEPLALPGLMIPVADCLS